MMRHGGSAAINTATLLAKKGLLGAEVAAPNKWASLVIRNGSTFAANLSDQKEKTTSSQGSAGANGGNKDEKGIMSYWGIHPSKITKQDGTEWKWNCFRVCILLHISTNVFYIYAYLSDLDFCKCSHGRHTKQMLRLI